MKVLHSKNMIKHKRRNRLLIRKTLLKNFFEMKKGAEDICDWDEQQLNKFLTTNNLRKEANILLHNEISGGDLEFLLTNQEGLNILKEELEMEEEGIYRLLQLYILILE